MADNQNLETAKFLYRLYLNDIASAKKQQWQTAYYFFILQGLIIRYKSIFTSNIYSISASVVVTALSFSIIYMYKIDIKNYANRKDDLKTLFPIKIRNILEKKKKPYFLDLFKAFVLVFVSMQALIILILLQFLPYTL